MLAFVVDVMVVSGERPGCTLPAAPRSGPTIELLQDWLNEFERIQLMLRLSARLRQKYQD